MALTNTQHTATFGPPSNTSTISATVDSASALHIASPSTVSRDTFTNTGPSDVRCMMADGTITPATNFGTTSFASPETLGKTPDDILMFHVLPGNRTWLFSLPELSRAGFDFFLTDRGPSLMIPPSGSPIVLGRSAGSSGFWSVDFDFPSGPGLMRILNDRFHDTSWSPCPILETYVSHRPDKPKPQDVSAISIPDSVNPFDPALPGPDAVPPFDLALHLASVALSHDAHTTESLWSRSTGTTRTSPDLETALHIMQLTVGPQTRRSKRRAEQAPLPPAPPAEDDNAETATSYFRRDFNTTPHGGLTPVPRRIPGRRPPLNGPALHAAIGHPSHAMLDAWTKCASGFPRKIRHEAKCRCPSCMGGAMRRCAVPKISPSRVLSHHSRGEKWFIDFSRYWEPDIWGYTCFILFVDQATDYPKIYLLKHHAEFWNVAQAHVEYVRIHFNTEIRILGADHDPVWSKFGGSDPDTSEAAEFKRRNNIRFSRSPPETQAMNAAENRMAAVNALINIQLQHAHASPRAWGGAARNTETILQMTPVYTSTKPLLRRLDGTRISPMEAMSPGREPDISLLTASYFSLCWAKIYGSKPNQLRRQAVPCLYLGLADGTIGWRVLPLENVGNPNPKTMVTYHLTISHDMSRRPSVLATHDELLSNTTPFSAGPALHHRMIRELFASSPTHNVGLKTMIVHSPLTGAPVALEPIFDTTTQRHLLMEASVKGPTGDPTGARVTTSHPTSGVPIVGPTCSPTRPAAPARARQTARPTTGAPAAPMTGHISEMRRLPLNTTVQYIRDNPKLEGSMSHSRYELYKSATSIADYLRLHRGNKTQAYADLKHDFAHNFVVIPTAQAVRLIHPILALAAFHGSPSIIHEQHDAHIVASITELPISTPAEHSQTTPIYDISEPQYSAYSAQIHGVVVHRDTLTAQDGTPDCTLISPTDLHIAPPDPTARPIPSAKLHRELASEIRALSGIPQSVTSDGLIDTVTNSIEAKLKALGPYEPAHDTMSAYVDTAFAEAPFVYSVDTNTAPKSVNDMMQLTDRELWLDAAIAELDQLLNKYSCFTHVHEAEARKAVRKGAARYVPTKWVNVYKQKSISLSEATLGRRKCRLVACEAVGRFDVADTWSPTIGIDSTRLLFVIAAMHGMEILTLDVSGAYLMGSRPPNEDTVYLRMPSGLEHIIAAMKARKIKPDPRLLYLAPDGSPMVWKCDGNLYGLQSAGKIFWLYAREWLISIGFTQATVDPCIFIRRTADGTIIVGLYVDDSLNLFSNTTVKAWYLAAFAEKFDQSPDSGEDHCEFLAISYTVSDDGTHISLNTPKLWGKLRQALSEVPLPTVTSPLPAAAVELLSADASDTNPIVDRDTCHVRSILGIAAWGVLAVRPAEAHATALIARYAHRPTRNVVTCLYHLCSFLIQRSGDVLNIRQNGQQIFQSFVDSSWANDPTTSRSWFGYALVWGGCPFLFRSKLESCVALSTRDAEAIAAVYVVRAMLGTLILLNEIGFLDHLPEDVLPLSCGVDNKATVDGTTSDKIYKDSRFMAMRLRWLREIVSRGFVALRYVQTRDNVADIFTKLLSPSDHDRLRIALMSGHLRDMFPPAIPTAKQLVK